MLSVAFLVATPATARDGVKPSAVTAAAARNATVDAATTNATTNSPAAQPVKKGTKVKGGGGVSVPVLGAIGLGGAVVAAVASGGKSNASPR
jgi:hypothetical protein